MGFAGAGLGRLVGRSLAFKGILMEYPLIRLEQSYPPVATRPRAEARRFPSGNNTGGVPVEENDE